MKPKQVIITQVLPFAPDRTLFLRNVFLRTPVRITQIWSPRIEDAKRFDRKQAAYLLRRFRPGRESKLASLPS